VFGFSKPSGHTSDTVVLTSTTTNATPTPISDFELQAAVPKAPHYHLIRSLSLSLSLESSRSTTD
jgi:hypothetical protein